MNSNVWVKASERLPIEKGYYISRRPTLRGTSWIVENKPFNPKYEDTHLDNWKNYDIEWLDEQPIIEVPVEDKKMATYSCPNCGFTKDFEVVNNTFIPPNHVCWNNTLYKQKEVPVSEDVPVHHIVSGGLRPVGEVGGKGLKIEEVSVSEDVELKDYVVICDYGNDIEVWTKSKYDKYVKDALSHGACPAVRIVTTFNKEDDFLAIQSTPISEQSQIDKAIEWCNNNIVHFKSQSSYSAAREGALMAYQQMLQYLQSIK
jgi:hypothetical protein